MISPEAEALYRWRQANPYTGSLLHCAGCGKPLDQEGYFEPGDGSRIHPGERLVDCLIEYGRRREAEGMAATRIAIP